MKDVKQEWNDYIKQSYEYPEALSGVEERLKERIARNRIKRKAVFGSLSAVAAVFIFIILVNTNAAFAGCVSNLPVIGNLAEFVKFDKGLSNAIENDYVQEVGLISWDGDKQLSLPYVIADEKNLVLFFRLPEDYDLKSNEFADISLKEMRNSETGEKIEISYSSSSLSAEESKKDTGFLQQSYLFSEGDLPKSIELKVNLEIEGIPDSENGQMAEPDGEEEPESIRKTIGTFTFQLDFKEFAKPRIYEFHKSLVVEKQRMTLEEVKVYPAGTEVSFTFPDENSAWIKGLDLAIEQNGKVISEGKNGISSTGDGKKKSIFIESNYFEKPSAQSLLIRGVRLLDKDKEYITVDLNNRTITPAIPGMSVKEVIKGKNGMAQLVFSTKVNDDNICFGMFHNYSDMEGNTYELSSESMTNIDRIMETRITVQCPPDGKLVFQRELTPMQYLEEPVKIELPQ